MTFLAEVVPYLLINALGSRRARRAVPAQGRSARMGVRAMTRTVHLLSRNAHRSRR
jgi:hypothetical protein